MDDDGSIPSGIEAQTSLVVQKIARVLAETGLSLSDVAKMTTYLVSAADIPGYSGVRNELLSDIGLNRPGFAGGRFV